MIETPTVLILGAGASKPYDYPLGIELKDEIIRKLDCMNYHNLGWINELKFDVDLVEEFIKNFKASNRTSIDAFLNYHKKEYASIGKMAIVDIISSCENRPKKLTKEEILHPKNKADDWYSYLAGFLYDCEFEDITDNKLSIISYNYDRSLESFLYDSLRVDYKEGEFPEECESKIKEIPFVHMYGRLDPLPWEAKGGRIYGQECSTDKLVEISKKNIKLIHEAEKEGIPKLADELIKKAKRIYFLGLDLRRQENLKLLNLSNLYKKEIIGTAFRLEMSEIAQIKNFLNKYSQTYFNPGSGPIIENEKSLLMIRKYMSFK